MRRTVGSAAVAAVVALSALGAGAALLPGPARAASGLTMPGTVRTPEQPAPRALEVVRVDGVDHLDVHDVARLFHGTKYWRSELEKMVLKIDGHRIRLTVGSPYVYVDDEGTNLLAPVRWHEGRILVPVRLLTAVIDPLVTESVAWDPETLRLGIATSDPNVLGIGWDVRSNGTVVTVRLAKPLSGRLEYPRPDRIVLRIPDGVLAKRMEGGRRGLGLLDSLETRQDPAAASLVFHLGPLGGAAELLTRASPPRLVLTVSEGLREDVPLPDFERPDAGSDLARARTLRTLVIDPGHGGSDTGVTGAEGLAEKEITLAIAQRLESLLERDGDLRVVLTRDGDRFVSPTDRAGLANGANADLVLSLHANGWFDGGRRGFAVGVRPPGAPPEEGDVSRWGSRPAVADRDAGLFAEILRDAMKGLEALPDAGIRSEPWTELTGVLAPAVHLECGYLTNRNDVALLADPGFQDGIAAAIVLALEEYRGVLADEGGGAP